MKNDDLDVLIKQAGLPPSRYKNKPDKLKITTYLFAETQQELKELVEEKMGPDFHTKVVRMQASGDGSYGRRSYNNNARSPMGQYQFICSQTGLVVWFGYRQNSCSMCNRMATSGRYFRHNCNANTDGGTGGFEECMVKVGDFLSHLRKIL